MAIIINTVHYDTLLSYRDRILKNYDAFNVEIAYINEHKKLKWVRLQIADTQPTTGIIAYHQFDEMSFIVAIRSHGNPLDDSLQLLILHPLERLLLNTNVGLTSNLSVNIGINDISIQDFRPKGEYIIFPLT